jgi:hypothetical protein
LTAFLVEILPVSVQQAAAHQKHSGKLGKMDPENLGFKWDYDGDILGRKKRLTPPTTSILSIT